MDCHNRITYDCPWSERMWRWKNLGHKASSQQTTLAVHNPPALRWVNSLQIVGFPGCQVWFSKHPVVDVWSLMTCYDSPNYRHVGTSVVLTPHNVVPPSYRRKFRSETSDNMDSWKAEVGRVRREKIRREKIRREKVRRKKMQMREKVGKSRNTVFFHWFVAPEGRKVGSLKRRVRSQLARWEMKICTPLWREAHFQVEMDKTLEDRTTFGCCDVEKVHAVVARSTFRSQNVQNTPGSDHFWKFRCRKSARRCGAKHILKSKCTKYRNLGPLLEVAMSKKCTPLWREAHFQVKRHKTHHVRTTFGVWDVEFRKSARRCGAKQISKSECPKHTMFGPLLESEMSSFEKVHAVVARSTVPSQNVQNTPGSDHFWRFRCRFASLCVTSLHYMTLHYTTLRAVEMLFRAAGTCSADR